MPDKRKHRGAHPEDKRLLAESEHPALQRAVAEHSWLLSRGYAEASTLELVGNRHNLTERQRIAVRRSACSDQSLQQRKTTMRPLSACAGRSLAIDGYNLLITLESALSDGVILIGRDGCCRDLASVHGTYRKVEETLPAVEMIAKHLSSAGVHTIDWYLDRPVSNSGRLKALMAEWLEARGLRWNIELVDNPDAVLAARSEPVVSSDAWILDRCTAWVNLAADIIGARLPASWRVDLRG